MAFTYITTILGNDSRLDRLFRFRAMVSNFFLVDTSDDKTGRDGSRRHA